MIKNKQPRPWAITCTVFTWALLCGNSETRADQYAASQRQTGNPREVLRRIDDTVAQRPACVDESTFLQLNQMNSKYAAKLCAGLETLDDAKRAKTMAFEHAKKEVLSRLDPKIREAIEGPADFDKLLEQVTRHVPYDLLLNETNPRVAVKIKKLYPEYHQARENYFRAFETYEASLYKASGDALSNEDLGEELTPEKTEKQAQDLKNKLLAEVLSDRHLSEYMKKDASLRLQKLQVITVHSLQQEKNPAEREAKLELLKKTCGKSLSAPNASANFYEPTNPKTAKKADSTNWYPTLAVCPGLVASLAHLKGKNQALNFVLAHELSHLLTAAIPQQKKSRGLKPEYPLGIDETVRHAYEPLLDCLQKNYGAQLRPLSGAAALLKALVEKDKKTDPTKSSYSYESLLLGDLQELETQLHVFLQRQPTEVDSHAVEILADYWATRVLGADAQKSRDLRPASAQVANMVAFFCMVRDTDNQVVPGGDEGVHPSFDFRIANFLRYPAVNKLLQQSGFSPLPTEHWCDLAQTQSDL